MNILYIHQYFTTPEEPGGTRSYWISQELVRRGHHVTMISATNKFHPKACRINIDGIDVIYVKNVYSNYMSALRRVISFVSFIRLSLKEAKRQKDIDLVFATSTPLTIGYIALNLKNTRKWNYVFEVRDLWPEFPIQIGAIKNKLLIKFLRKIEKKIYDKSEYVIALSPGMMEGILKVGTPEDKCCVIPNMSKPDIFFPHKPLREIIEKFSLDTNKFNVIYFGSMGHANGLEYIIEAAKYLKDNGADFVNFIFMGDGVTCPLLKHKVEYYQLTNVQYLGNHKMGIVSEVVNCCDASIITFMNLPILRTNSPNKLFDSLSAGKPIIVNSSGWTKDIVEKENCGFFVDPEKPEELAYMLIKIKDNKGLLDEWGKNSRRLSVEVFDKHILSANVADVLEKVCNEK
ncbi:MAG: glycosyltransferase family 4 protein [Bacteroidales bacterium]|nr:glycosyltransferase family 4 protein [Bacteroidales bacterium]